MYFHKRMACAIRLDSGGPATAAFHALYMIGFELAERAGTDESDVTG
jgi:predicted GNAT superfamily acetyltransferase